MRQQNEMDGAEDVQGEPGNEIVTAANCGRISDHNWEAGDDAEDAQAMVREFVNAAMDMMNEESRGMMPAHFTSQVAMINKPSVSPGRQSSRNISAPSAQANLVYANHQTN